MAIDQFSFTVHPGNHTSVFGSWWSDGIWGFACCHQVSVRAYCTGQAGIEAAAASARMLDLSTHQNGDGQQDDEVISLHHGLCCILTDGDLR